MDVDQGMISHEVQPAILMFPNVKWSGQWGCNDSLCFSISLREVLCNSMRPEHTPTNGHGTVSHSQRGKNLEMCINVVTHFSRQNGF